MDDADTAFQGVIGREQELATVSEFLDGAPPPALLIAGAPGIGKTAVWEATVTAARERNFTVLVAHPSEAEEELSFAALTDLLDDVDETVTDRLPAAQRHALDVALARAEPIGAPPEPLAIATGLLGMLRSEELGERVLVAIDDAQWLDGASAGALAFACRRGLSERVRLLVTVRLGVEAAIERELTWRRLELDSISLVQARALIHERLGLNVPRPLMAAIVEAADGNPLVVLELGRLLLEQGRLELGAELPVPELAGELFGTRVRELPESVADVLLVASLSAQLTRAELIAAADPSAVAEASAYGVLSVERDRVRAAHPLLGAAAQNRATEEQLKAVHLRLSRALGGHERAARHLALATSEPDGERAAVIADAARAARQRGASRDAADLAEHAARLTPDGDPAEVDRLLTLGDYLMSAGEMERLAALFEGGAIDELPAGPARARAHMLVGERANQASHVAHLEAAIAESAANPELRALALAAKALLFSILVVRQIPEGVRSSEEALEALKMSDDPRPMRRVLTAVAWPRAMRGMPIADLQTAFDAAADTGASLYEASVDRVAGVRHGFRGELEQAQRTFERLIAAADGRGEVLSGEVMRLHLCEMALRRGDCRLVWQTLDEWEQWATLEELEVSRIRARALVSALSGDGEQACVAAAAMADVREPPVWDELEVARALGIAALFDGEFERAAERLGSVWDHCEREGVTDPGAFPVAADLAAALTELGRAEEALAIAERVRTLADAQDHPWGRATAARCEALVKLASSWDEDSAQELVSAAEAYGGLGLGFDQARTLLALGGAERRYRKWGRARDSLEQAANVFDSLGSAGWAQRARSELERVGARKPAVDGALTSAEAKVVALAADGMSNKQIAAELVVTVHTVEVHLSRAYAKLGVRSRRQLAQALAALE